jgi:hypothetical protein
MSKQTAELLEAFEAIAPDEKRIFTAEFLRRAVPFDCGPLDDEETAHAADSLLSLLDAEEKCRRIEVRFWLFDLGMAKKVRPTELFASRRFREDNFSPASRAAR